MSKVIKKRAKPQWFVTSSPRGIASLDASQSLGIMMLGIDDYEGHLEYSEITDFPHIFFPDYRQPWYSYMKDQVGTIYKVHSMKTRAIAESRVYDTFGIPGGDSITSCFAEPQQSDANLVNQTGTATTPLGFQGKYYDAESGLNYFYHRYYNPAIGRFMIEDPAGFKGGVNFYSFVDNDSINYIDFFGLLKTYRDFSMEEKTDYNFFPRHPLFGFLGFRQPGITTPSIKIDICCNPNNKGKYQLDCTLNYVIKSFYYSIDTTYRDHEQIHLSVWRRGYPVLVDFLLNIEKMTFDNKNECEKMKENILDRINNWIKWRHKVSNTRAGH